MASLDDLPEHVVGHLFSLLPDAASKKAFFSCSPIVRGAPSVLNQVQKLTVPLQQLCDGRHLDPLRSSLAFTKGAQLKELVITGSATDLPGSKGPSDSLLILQLPRCQDEDMRARLQQVTRITLDGCRIKPDHEAQLGAFLRALPHLESLTFKNDYSSNSSHAALISSLSAAPVDGCASLCLKELCCTDVDAHSIQAINRLSSLESLSWWCLNARDETPHRLSSLESLSWWRLNTRGEIPHVLQPLSSLTALRHLSIGLVGNRFDDGLGTALPHLQYLSSLELGSLCYLYPLSAIPRSVCYLELLQIDPEMLCSSLGATVQGSGLTSSLRQLRVRRLVFVSDAQLNNNLHDWRELGLHTASHLEALPSLLLSVDRVCSAPSLSPFLAFIEPVPELALKLTSFVTDLDEEDLGIIPPTDLARLATLCPNIEELSLMPDNGGIVLFEDLWASLNEISGGFPRLASFCFIVNAEEPDFVSVCVDFCIALATDQKRCGKVSTIKGLVFLTADPLLSEGVEAEGMMLHVESLERAWAQANASLHGKVCEVSLEVS